MADAPQKTRSANDILRHSVTAGLQAARRNRSPGIALWLFGCAIVAGYFLVPSVHEALNQVAQWKTRGGLWFSAASTALFGGLIPCLIQWMAGRPSRFAATYPLSSTLFWAAKGVEIDLLYRLQAICFGEGSGWSVIVVKTLVDQFVYVPWIGLLNVVLFYWWRDDGWRCDRFRQRLGRYWYREGVVPVLVANWLVWIPAVVLIYCFPVALQLPVQNLILCFWILVLTVLTAPKGGH
jgi:hypothetical protein